MTDYETKLKTSHLSNIIELSSKINRKLDN